MLKVINRPLDESIVVKADPKDKYGQKRIIVQSDNPDPREAGNETFKTKEVLKKYKATWDKVDKHWYWNDRFNSADEIAKLANDAVREANQMLGAAPDSHTEITGYDSIEQIEKVKEFLVTVKGAVEAVKNVSGKVTKDLLDSYINGLADKLDDSALLDDVVAFNKAAKAYILDTGHYSYSPYNTFLIWLQATKGSHEFGSKPYWLGRGFEPKPGAREILILKSTNTGSLSNNVKTIIKSHPNSPQEYARENPGFKIVDPKNPIPVEKYNAFWNWARGKGYAKTMAAKSFMEVAIFDDKNVQPIAGREQINPPVGPKWYNDDDTEDEKCTAIIDALHKFCSDNGINISREDSIGWSGGARGSSSGGHIKLITGSAGAGMLATFVHEIAHELMHWPNQVDYGKLFLGRDFTSEEKELHADAVAYTVLSSYDIPAEHSITYLAGWKADKARVQKYQKAIRDTSFFIIKQIEKYATENLDMHNTDEAKPDMVQESVSYIVGLISELKKLK